MALFTIFSRREDVVAARTPPRLSLTYERPPRGETSSLKELPPEWTRPKVATTRPTDVHAKACRMSSATRCSEEPLVLFASTAARPKEVENDLAQLKLQRPLKTLQGQVLFSPADASNVQTLALSLRKLTTLDYVHVLLASCAISPSEVRAPETQPTRAEHDGDDSALCAIHDAAAAVSAVAFGRAIDLWRALGRLEGRPEATLETATAQLIFRALGKRGGRGHTFTSDDAKRAAKQGLTAATGLAGSSSKELAHLDVLAQVHCNRFWLGLRLNRIPLAPQPTAGNGTDRAAAGAQKEEGLPTKSPPSSQPAARAAPPARREDIGDVERFCTVDPPLLSGWLVSRLRELGIDRPRDARDAVAPLWEIPLAEQRTRKEAEMKALIENKLMREATGASGSAAGDSKAAAAAAAAVFTPIRSGGSMESGPLRNTCDFHIGRDREGKICCGFRLGVGSSRDGMAVGAVHDVPFVPAWMAHTVSAMEAALRGLEGNQGVVATLASPLPYATLRLRGSLRTHEAVAMLTPTAGSAMRSATDDAELAHRLVDAAAEHGQRLIAVLARRNDTGGGSPDAGDSHEWHSLLGASHNDQRPAAIPPVEPGTIIEELASGLRLQIAPLAFFQASTDAADILFQTVVELALGGEKAGSAKPPSLVLDLCCGGGALGLEVARAASSSNATRVLGIELNASAVRDAKRNAAANGLLPPQYEATCAKVEDALDSVLASKRASENAVAILDPPRTGMAPSVCKALRSANGVDRVVFVSCNPHGHTLRHDYVVKGGSLAANIKTLTGPRGRGAPFTLVRAVPIDMFAHTPHVELCLLLERSSTSSVVDAGSQPTEIA